MTGFRVIPSIERLRQRAAVQALEARHGHVLVVEALREAADALRAAMTEGTAAPSSEEIAADLIEQSLERRLETRLRPSLCRLINATGVIIHTNLGRAPLASVAARRVADLAGGYTNLEYDLEAGSRGSRDTHAERLLCQLTGAEAAVVANNNAAATMLVLAALAAGREVVISRGELVEIGGGFRVPDVMVQSGALLREVGTTNRTRVADYAAAISERTALILRVHPSNFRIEGFTERPPLDGLVALGHRFGVPVAEDLGSGWLGGPAGQPGEPLMGEPDVGASVRAGVDVACFSGDKLLGGPQAGIIVGRHDALARIRSHPLMRALRVDKMTYAALEATLQEHLSGRASESVPVVRMIAVAPADIAPRADALAARLAAVGFLTELLDGTSTVGGGSAPGSALPTRLVAIARPGETPDTLETRLRRLDPPVLARIETGRLVLDLRTVQPEEDEMLGTALASLADADARSAL
jgi:L-seryl-tRNA(Ser) seleniumtransferase